MTLHVKGKKDITSTVISKLKACAPRTHELMWEVSRSTVDIASRVKYKLTTGIESFDTALGGGLPFGRVVELYGLESCGKTSMVTRCAARLQGRHIIQADQHGKPGDADFRVDWVPVPKSVDVFTLYIDNEQSLDADQKLVVDGEVIDVAVGRSDTVDQMFKMIDVAINAIDEVADDEHPCFILVVVDTVGGTSSREEMKAKWESQDFPRSPKMLRMAFRRMMRKINKRNVLAIFTNQVGTSFNKTRSLGGGLPRDEDFSSPGGRALKFFASVRVFMYQVNAHYKLHKEQQFPSGFSAGFVVVKNRMTKPLRAGRFVLLYDRGLSNVYSVLETLVFLKLAKAGKAEEGDKGAISFRFKYFKIATATYPDEKNDRGDPRLDSRAEWPAYYEAHKVDIDKLWEKAKEVLFAIEGEVGIADATLGEDTDEDLDPAEAIGMAEDEDGDTDLEPDSK